MDGVAKRIRWSRFLHEDSRRGVIVPIDHGLTLGPIQGLESLEQIGRWIRHPVITGVLAHKGLIERLVDQGLLRRQGVMVHLNGMTSLSSTPNRKEILTSVERALRLGADAVSLQLNFDGTNDASNLVMLGRAVDEAHDEGLPVLAMVYDKTEPAREEQRLLRMRHLMRACVELGADALKIAAPARLALLPVLLDGIQEHTAVFFAGGSKCSDEEFLALTQEAVACGATGLCVGRNVFQRERPSLLLDRVWDLLQGDPAASSQGAAAFLTQGFSEAVK
ncbi:class I fructose-bisphosphate aldolase [Stigmatella erecta]|uniref:2-amino-3,7-dideoxy-D-threo-hept-6-ulosonate synthase n=1 Tax=Stigmatella erecta TaxID=83460 RepID=A0A1I0K4S2_9BACT|nr:aldolase [Stigmatella erecta]SEU18078.1 2-amino-3,7-dideoxy-D-threo-hept-6-ulosonate synthase [Stigmatella erecta]